MDVLGLLNALPDAVEREGDVRRLQAAKDQLARALSMVEPTKPVPALRPIWSLRRFTTHHSRK